MQQWLGRAAQKLGVRIVVGYVVRLPDADECPTEALFPELGGALGTLVLNSANTIDAPTRNALLSLGFSISTFSEPLSSEQFDIGSYAEMFAEWGASNEKPKPIWMN